MFSMPSRRLNELERQLGKLFCPLMTEVLFSFVILFHGSFCNDHLGISHNRMIWVVRPWGLTWLVREYLRDSRGVGDSSSHWIKVYVLIKRKDLTKSLLEKAEIFKFRILQTFLITANEKYM